jgi:hypothetical protein
MKYATRTAWFTIRIRLWRVPLGMFCALAFAGLAAVADANSGTKLSVVTEADRHVCSADNTSATVIVTAAVTSSGSTAPASVLVSTDGGVTFTQVHTIAETDWLHNGRTKTAEVEIELTLTANVLTPVTVCFLQPGANGNELKKACSDLSITPICSGDPGGGR